MVSSTSSSTQLVYNPIHNHKTLIAINKIGDRFSRIIERNGGNNSERGINLQITKFLAQEPLLKKQEKHFLSFFKLNSAFWVKEFRDGQLKLLKLINLTLKPSILQKEKEDLQKEIVNLPKETAKKILSMMREIDNNEALSSPNEKKEKKRIILQKMTQEFLFAQQQHREALEEHNRRPHFIGIEQEREYIEPYVELLAAEPTVSWKEKERRLTELLTGIGLERYQKYVIPYLNLLKPGTTVSPEEKKQKIQELLKKVGSIPLSDAAHYNAFKNDTNSLNPD